MPDDTAPLWRSLPGLLVYGLVMGAVVLAGVAWLVFVLAASFAAGLAMVGLLVVLL